MLNRLSTTAFISITLFILFGTVLILAKLNQQEATSPPYKSYDSGDFFFPPYESENDRLGYDKTSNHDTTPLNGSWYMDWGVSKAPGHINGVEYARTIYFKLNGVSRCQGASKHSQVTPNITGTILIENLQAHPGALWLVGNEPDSYYNGSPIMPELYAEMYHYFYTTIKTADPTAKVAVGAIVQPSPLRIAYLDKVLTHYQTTYNEPFPTDLWNIHLYHFNEGTCDASWGAAVPPGSSTNQGWSVPFSPNGLLNLTAIEQSIRDFRQWMYDQGYNNMPLIISEYGVLPPPSYNGFGNDVAAQFLEDTSNMFLTITDSETGYAADGNRLIQMWAWFATDHQPPPGYFKYGGDLFQTGTTDELTVIGERFATIANTHYTDYVDLYVAPATPVWDGQTVSGGGYIGNRGNISATNVPLGLSLTDYFSQQIVDSREVNMGDIGRRYAHTDVYSDTTWDIQDFEAYTLTITVDPNNLLGEVNRTNNQLTQLLTLYPDLALTSLAAPTLLVNPNQTITPVITLTVRNVGNWTSTQTIASLSVMNNGQDEVSQNLTVPSLGINAEALVTTTLPISEISLYQLNTIVNPDQDINLEFNFTNNQIQTTFSLLDEQGLAIHKIGPDIVEAGGLITYTLQITNESRVTLTDVVVTDTIPLGATYITGGTKIGQVVSWTVPSIASNQATSLEFAVTATQALVNWNYAAFERNIGFRTQGAKLVLTRITGQPPLLNINKTGPIKTTAGAVVNYALTVTNNSPLVFTDLIISDTLPFGANYVPVSGGNLVNNTVVWTIPTLAADGGQVTVTFAVTTTQTITNDNYKVQTAQGVSAVGNEVVVTAIGVGTVVNPEWPDPVIITDTQQSKVTQMLIIYVPPQAVSQTTNLIYTRLPNPNELVSQDNLGNLDLRFYLELQADGSGSLPLPLEPFNQPLTITVDYTDTYLFDETTLDLYYFDAQQPEGQRWVPAYTTCTVEEQHHSYDTTANILQLRICHPGEFILLHQLQQVYLPIVFKDSN